MLKCWLDAGHGGKDSGASDFGIYEKDCNLEIVLAIRDILLNDFDNVEVKLTRSTDIFVSLKDRTDAANDWGADFFLSVHCDANPSGAANGFSSFIYLQSDDKTKEMQSVIHKEVLKLIPETKDHGIRQGDFHVVRQTHMPALLTENGFITNAKDAKRLQSPEFIRRLAEGHCNGIASFYGLKKKEGAILDYKGHWAEKDIVRVIEVGIMNGYSDGTFKPDQPVTRAQLAVVALRLLDRKG